MVLQATIAKYATATDLQLSDVIPFAKLVERDFLASSLPAAVELQSNSGSPAQTVVVDMLADRRQWSLGA